MAVALIGRVNALQSRLSAVGEQTLPWSSPPPKILSTKFQGMTVKRHPPQTLKSLTVQVWPGYTPAFVVGVPPSASVRTSWYLGIWFSLPFLITYVQTNKSWVNQSHPGRRFKLPIGPEAQKNTPHTWSGKNRGVRCPYAVYGPFFTLLAAPRHSPTSWHTRA